jgi:hypothetical protein
MSIPMQVTPGTLTPGFCPTSEQVRLNAFAAALAVTFPLGLFNGSFGNPTPAPDMQSFPWYRLNSDGSPDRWYTYFDGAWVAPHPVAANDTAAIRFFQGSYASIGTYDGGDTNSPGFASGPMWQVIGQTTGGATDYGSMGGLVPIGVSANFAQGATGYPPNASATPTTTLGQVSLGATNMPAHPHLLNAQVTNVPIGSGLPAAIPSTAEPGSTQPSGYVVGGNSTGFMADGITPNPPTPFYGFPWMAGWWICRTGRVFYLASEGA